MQIELDLSIERAKLDKIMRTFFGIKNDFEGEASLQLLFGNLSELNVILCGGAILSLFTGAKVNDLDFYTVDGNIGAVHRLFQSMGYDNVVDTDAAISYVKTSGRSKHKIQLIKKFRGSPEDIFDSFDFTVCTGSFVFKTDEFVLGKRFLQDVARRRLVYQGNSQYPFCAMYRTKKYQERGYKLPGSTIAHIGLSIMRLEIQNYGDLKEQLRGIDTQFLDKFLSDDRRDEALPVSYGEIIDEIFEAMGLENL